MHFPNVAEECCNGPFFFFKMAADAILKTRKVMSLEPYWPKRANEVPFHTNFRITDTMKWFLQFLETILAYKSKMAAKAI